MAKYMGVLSRVGAPAGGQKSVLDAEWHRVFRSRCSVRVFHKKQPNDSGGKVLLDAYHVLFVGTTRMFVVKKKAV